MIAANTLTRGQFVSGKTFTVKEVAERLGVPRPTLIDWIKRGKFPNAKKKNPYAVTSPFEIPEQDVMDFIESEGDNKN